MPLVPAGYIMGVSGSPSTGKGTTMRRRIIALSAAMDLALGLLALGIQAASAKTITSPVAQLAGGNGRDPYGAPALPDQPGTKVSASVRNDYEPTGED
jgi:hypothetical protein